MALSDQNKKRKNERKGLLAREQRQDTQEEEDLTVSKILRYLRPKRPK